MPNETLTAAARSALPNDRKALPIENGRPRVQRLVERLEPVHLEIAPPENGNWKLEVNGFVEQSLNLSIGELRELGETAHVADFHCVWGWSRPRVGWTGVSTAKLLDAARVQSGATHVRFEAAGGNYAACVPIEQAREGFLALGLDGGPLPAIHGGPLRWVQPHHLWGYKGVKWLTGVVLLDRLEAGPWETCVGDVPGEVPPALIDRFRLLPGGEGDFEFDELEYQNDGKEDDR